jgi:uncharacterized protein (TIGR03118 family)
MATDNSSPAAQAVIAMPVLQTNLVSDGFVPANHIDPNLINPWGVSFSPTGPFWVSDAGTGVTTIYNSTGAPFPVAGQTAITIGVSEGTTRAAIPTGQVFNGGTGGFTISEDGHSASSSFLFATINGTISGWSPAVAADHTVIAHDDSDEGASYTGLAIASTDGGKLLFAADFHNKEVAVYDQNFQELAPVTDPLLPGDYAPFNVQVLDGHLFIAYAQQGETGRAVAGEGKGYVDEFDLDGHLLQRVASEGPLNAPWGLAIAPASFGEFAGDLLVGNFGDGTINVFDRETSAFLGKLSGPDGEPIQNDFLWALVNGNGGNAGDADRVYLTAGIGDEEHGVLASLTPLPATPAGTVDWDALAAQVLANFEQTGQWFV